MSKSMPGRVQVLTMLALFVSGCFCVPIPGPGDALIAQQVECMNRIADRLAKVTDVPSAEAALAELRATCEKLGKARREFNALTHTNNSGAWTAGVQAQGGGLVMATNKLQNELVRIAMIPGTADVLTRLTAAMR